MSKFVEANEKIAEGVVKGYKKIEEGVVGGYKTLKPAWSKALVKLLINALRCCLLKRAKALRMPRKGFPVTKNKRINITETFPKNHKNIGTI